MAETAVKEFHHRADVSAQRIARVYARALLAASTKAGARNDVLAELDGFFDEVIEPHPELRELFIGSAVGRNARRDIIEKAFTGHIHPVLYNFVQVLNDHERLDLFRAIAAAAHELD